MKICREFSDVACLAQLRASEPQAFTDLFALYARGLGQFVHGYLKSAADAEEVVQDCFLKVWERRHEFDEGIVFKTYLYTCAYHAVLKQLRRQRTWVFEDCHQELLVTDDSSTQQMEYAELEELYQVALAQLPPKRRQVFALSRQAGLSYAGIAQELNISVKSVETQMTLALKFLRTYFRAHGTTITIILLLLQV
ncbi:RNA polymerase sigma-70 factor [uncultured Hymenobacter sp.]|uniref:RNA polymerase sigma-70 factor n=1 Tax=uncultured Hymenobacter sp. TaxID=170016 RepID=UPI0035CB9B5C